MIIIGYRTSTRVIEWGQFLCPNCQTRQNYTRKRSAPYFTLSGFALVILLAFSQFSCLRGQRFIDVHIERDGQLILQTGYGVSDSLDAAAMWESLNGELFDAVGTIEPEADDPKRAVLKGKILIVILHVSNEITRANVDELRLIRPPGSGDRWQLAPDEAQRTAKAAGL
jgi:hypothetical protein